MYQVGAQQDQGQELLHLELCQHFVQFADLVAECYQADQHQKVAVVQVVLAGLVSTLPRWWGLSGFFIFVALLIIVVIVTEFVLFPSAANYAEN